MPQTTIATTGTDRKEIRQQPASWLRSLNNIDNLRVSIDSFLTPLLRKPDLRIVLTGAGTSALSATSLRHGLPATQEKHHRDTYDRSGHQPDGLLQPCAPAAAGLFRPFWQ